MRRAIAGTVRRAITVIAILATGCGLTDATPEAPRQPTITVAAASGLRPAFEQIAEQFMRQTGTEVILTFGSSGRLAEQIKQGAPYDVFASADTGFVDEVFEAGRADPETRAEYAFGRLAIWSRHDELAIGDINRPGMRAIAIANPRHAPYGVAAVEALRSNGLYDDVEPRLVYAENVGDALRLARSGNADAALVALSLALDAQDGEWSTIPADAHEPIRQTLVVTSSADNDGGARSFAQWVLGPEGRRVLERYGFELPAATPADPAPAR